MPSEDLSFDSFVVARWASLVRSAYLLTGDVTIAEDLAQEALVRCRREWRQVSTLAEPAERARAEMCRLHLSTYGRRFRGPAGDPPLVLPEDVDKQETFEADRVWAALRDLTPRQRTAVVLTNLEQADDEQAAQLMGLSSRSVRAAALSGVDRMQAALRQDDGRPAPATHLLRLLDRAASARLRKLPLPTDPLARVDVAVAMDRVGRRRRSALVAGVCVLLVGGFVVAQRVSAPQPPELTSGYPTYPAVHRFLELGAVQWPVVGALTTDLAATADLEAALARSSGTDGAASSSPRVVFADDVGDARVVLATDGAGHTWFLHGSRGEAFPTLDGYGVPAPPGSPVAPLTLLLPRPGPAADLLVVAPLGVRPQVATRPAVWPIRRPPYQPLEVRDGVSLTALANDPPFALSGLTVSTRGIAASGPVTSVVLSLDDVDPHVQDQRDARVLANRFGGPVGGAVVDAAATAVGAAGFDAGPMALSVPATTERRCPSAPCRLSVAVVEAVSRGVRSRTLAVHSGTLGEDVPAPLGMAGSETAGPADEDLPDHRPLSVTFQPMGFVGPVGTMVWCDSAGGTLRYSYRHGDGRRTASARIDRDGFGWLDAWEELQLLQVLDDEGIQRWQAD